MGSYTQAVPQSAADLMDALIKQPHDVSCSLLRQFPFQSLLDCCCGSNIELAKFVIQKGTYYGLDNGQIKKGQFVIDTAEEMTRHLELNFRQHLVRPFKIFKADVRQIPEEIPMVDIVHMRFGLMHLFQDQHRSVVKQLRSKAKQAVVLVERNWNTLTSTHKCKNHIELFVQTSLEFMSHVKANPTVGANLADIAESVAPGKVIYQTFALPEGNYVSDLIALSTMQKDMCKDRGLLVLSERFRQLETLFTYFREHDQPITHTPPEICTAVILP